MLHSSQSLLLWASVPSGTGSRGCESLSRGVGSQRTSSSLWPVHFSVGLRAAASANEIGAAETASSERHQPRRPTRPRLPVRPGDAALWWRRPRPPCTVSHVLLNSTHKSSSLAGIARTAAFGQSRQRRTLAQHDPSGLRAVAGAASATSAAAGSPPRKRAPRRRRGRPWPGRGMSPKRSRDAHQRMSNGPRRAGPDGRDCVEEGVESRLAYSAATSLRARTGSSGTTPGSVPCGGPAQAGRRCRIRSSGGDGGSASKKPLIASGQSSSVRPRHGRRGERRTRSASPATSTSPQTRASTNEG